MKTAVLAAQAGYSLTESFSRWREGECAGNASSNRESRWRHTAKRQQAGGPKMTERNMPQSVKTRFPSDMTFGKPRPVFVPPDDANSLIWRYTDLAKLKR